MQERFGVSLGEDPSLNQRALQLVEMAKIELEQVESIPLNLDFLLLDKVPPKSQWVLTRQHMEEVLTPIVERCAEPMERALKDAGISPDEVHAVVLVGGPTRMGVIRRFLAKKFGNKLYTAIDPMLCVSHGAAIQGAMLEGELKQALLLDVIPISLGIESEGGIFTQLIPRNATIPTKRNRIFTTVVNNQPGVSIQIFQGERAMAGDNVALGRFDLKDLPLVPRGVPQIEVTFEVDANGILHVSAEDLVTGEKQAMTIEAPLKMSSTEVERLLREARRAEGDDRSRKELAEAVNEARFVSYTISGYLEKYNGQIRPDLRDLLVQGKEDLEKALLCRETGELKKIHCDVIQTFSKTIQTMQVGSRIGTSAQKD